MTTTAYLLTIDAHDPTGGSGQTADLATWAALGWRGSSITTALTAQNSYGVQGVQAADVALLRNSLRTLLADGEPAAVKIGMISHAAVAEEVAQFVEARQCPVVWDPQLASADGSSPGPRRTVAVWPYVWRSGPISSPLTARKPAPCSICLPGRWGLRRPHGSTRFAAAGWKRARRIAPWW
jgi:Hydroxymethylpyrimidine/phosphomethylpyrimidine kinase